MSGDKTTRAQRVLFISHSGMRTGAPIMLLHFLRWLKGHTDIDFEIWLREGGELESDFAALARTSVIGVSSRAGRRAWMERARRRWALARLAAQPPAVVYSNTMTNGEVLDALSRIGRPVITHAHELEVMIRSQGQWNLDAVKRNTSRYVACAEAVKANLVANHGIPPGQIDVVHEFIEIPPSDPTPPAMKQRLSSELGIPANALVVGGAGTLDWRKSPDLFIQVARAVHTRRPQTPVHFVWVGGGGISPEGVTQLQHDVAMLNMNDRLHFIGPRPDAQAYFQEFDVFALTSREDPFPLVCLEAAAVGKPIVCFDGSGGEKEFVEEDCGFVVPYLDTGAMADRIVALLDSEALRRDYGIRAAEKVRLRHAVGLAAPKICDVLNRYLSTSVPFQETAAVGLRDAER